MKRFYNPAYGCRSSTATMHLKVPNRRVLYLLCWLTAMPLGTSLGHAATIESVLGIESVTQTDHTEVTIYLSGAAQFRSARLSDPERIYVDLPQVTCTLTSQPVPDSDPLVQHIRVGHPQRDSTRVVVDLKQKANFSVNVLSDPPRLTMILTPSALPLSKIKPPRMHSASSDNTPSSPALLLGPGPEVLVEPGPTDVVRMAELPPAPQPLAPTPKVPAAAPAGGPAAVISTTAAAQVPVLNIPRAARPPKLDDFLHGRPPSGDAIVTDFRQRDPGDGTPISQATSAYLSYDDQNLYVVFVCRDDPSKVRAHFSKRDNITDDDQVFVYLDTFRDRQHAYVFSANPVGVQADGIFTEGQTDTDYSFDAVWDSKGTLTKGGYIVWMSIPLKGLRFAKHLEQVWGIGLQRNIVRNSEEAFWPYVTHRTAGFLQQLGELKGLETVSPGRNVQLIPYGTFTHARTLDPTAPRLDMLNQGRVGLDAKAAVLGNALALDATINPDFSQVESDDPQVTINQRYEVYFPEKRPFFLENASFFQTPINLFFSRRIVDPEFGARLTGKLGQWDLGLLASDDRAPGEQFALGHPVPGSRAADGIFSLHREFGNQSTIGLLATNYDFGASYNRLFSLDTRLRLSPTWFFTGQVVKDYDRQPGSSQTQGQAYFADVNRSGRSFTYESSYTDFSAAFTAPLGYIKRVDIRKTDQFANYLWHRQNGVVRDYGPFVTGSIDWDHQAVLQDWTGGVGFNLDFKGPSGLRIARYEIFERYLNVPFRYYKDEAYFYASWRRWLDLFGTVDQGSGVNYQPASGLHAFLGNAMDISSGVTLRPSPRVRLDELYYYDRLALPISLVVYTNHLLRTKLNYQFTRALSLRAIVDYYAVLPNVSLIQQDRLKQLTGDILLTYMLNPGTALYIGYNNRHENLALESGSPPTLQRFGPPNYLTNSQIFIKASYLFGF